MESPQIVFFSANMRSTGSEIVLFNLLIEHYKRCNIKSILVITEDKGDLLDKLNSAATVHCFKDKSMNLIQKIRSLIAPKSTERFMLFNFLDDINKAYPNAIWYINTVSQPRVLHFAKTRHIPVIVHSHELDQIIHSMRTKDIRELAQYPKGIIACSHAAANAIHTIGYNGRISVSYPGFNVSNLIDSASSGQRDTFERDSLGIPKKAFIWSMIGTLDKNKNPLRFIEIAHHIIVKQPESHFMWIGKINDHALYAQAQSLSKKYQIESNIHWIGAIHHPEYYRYVNSADGFILTSNKESFSLVTIENLALGKPVVAFNCGGVSEIINDEIGHVLDSWDTQAMSTLMIDIMTGKKTFHKQMALKRAMDFDISHTYNAWLEKLNNLTA